MIRKQVVFILAVLMMFGISCSVSAEEILIEKEILEKILERQEALEKEVEELKRLMKKDVTSPEPGPAEDIEYLKEEVEDMSDRLDVVETNSILDKIQLGGEFRTQVDFLNFDNIKVNGEKKDGNTNELWSSRFRINLRSEITDDIIFHGRLSYLKYWGNTNFEGDGTDGRFFMTPDQEGDLHVERAYIDYFVPGTPFALTFGRYPTTEGPPYEFRNYTTRKATWPQMLVNGEFDGFIGSLSLEEWTSLRAAMLRFGYSKISQNYQQYQGLKIDSARVGFLSVEAEIPGIRDSLLWIGGYKMFDTFSLSAIPDTEFPEDSGTYETYTLHLQLNNIMESGLGWFGVFCFQDIHPRSEGTMLAPGYEIGFFGDSLHGDLGKRREGYAVYTGLRYILPIASLKHPHIGFEYNYGSKYWFPGSLYDGEATNKLGVNGHAYEFYYLQPIAERRMFCRIGTAYQDFEYDPAFYIYGSREGEEAKSDKSILHTYFLMDVKF
ncbi:DUF3373 family protein [Desulfobacterales bacterium HSG2]|nr:DUF3373 family protein [Desulfobacterales bacterium HSG2]